MSKDVAMIAGSLRIVADNVGGGDKDDLDAIDIREAADLIERLAAENRRLVKVSQWYAEKHSRARSEARRLAAEVERLTPREMTPDEIVATLNKHKMRGASFWERRNSHEGPSFAFMAPLWDEVVCYSLPEATYIAQGLLREATATTKEEAAR